VIPFLYQPFFFSSQELDSFSAITKKLSSILDRIIQEYVDNPKFRSYFDFSPQLEELILVDPGYEDDFPMARFDIFYYGIDNIKFCEFNADGSSGMVKTNILEEHFLNAEAVEKIKEKYQVDYCDVVNTWIETMLDCYNQFSDTEETPNIAIMDFDNYGMIGEFKHFKDLLIEQGYNVKIVDPRELEYRNNKLYSADFKVDLIYRRAVTTDLMDYYQELEDLWEAYQEQDVCLVGPIRSQIIHNKIIFAILHNSNQLPFLTKEEREFIADYIPGTELITLESEKKQQAIIAEQNRLVLKPLDDYGSNGVTIGADVSTEEWEREVKRIAANDDYYLVQEFCSLPERELAELEGTELSFNAYKFIVGLFAYQQQFKGVYTRAGQQNVIASSTGCVTLPNFRVES
ncbi:MAG: circularly permuted type 2 ATP-grasp protein, partial [Bacillota bacterium]